MREYTTILYSVYTWPMGHVHVRISASLPHPIVFPRKKSGLEKWEGKSSPADLRHSGLGIRGIKFLAASEGTERGVICTIVCALRVR